MDDKIICATCKQIKKHAIVRITAASYICIECCMVAHDLAQSMGLVVCINGLKRYNYQLTD